MKFFFIECKTYTTLHYQTKMPYKYVISRISMMNLLTETYTFVYDETYDSLDHAVQEFPAFCPPPTCNNEYGILHIRWEKVHSARRDMPFSSQNHLFNYLLENSDRAVIEAIVCSEGTVIYNAIKILKFEFVDSPDVAETPTVSDSTCETEVSPTACIPFVRLDM